MAVKLSHASLFLDLDGTLVPFQNDPNAVRMSPETVSLLVDAQARLGGRLAVLSGRSIASVDEVLGSGVLAVAGVHGLQRRNVLGAVVETPPHPAVERVAEVLAAFAAANGGLRIENKGQSVAIHFREAPSTQADVIKLVERLAHSSGLQVQHGAMVAEIRTPGPDKGFSLRQFMRTAPFAETRPIFIGDDLTDEPAFAAAQALRGAGILVGDRRDTAARGRLEDPAAVLGWIRRSLAAGAFDLAETEWRGRT